MLSHEAELLLLVLEFALDHGLLHLEALELLLLAGLVCNKSHGLFLGGGGEGEVVEPAFWVADHVRVFLFIQGKAVHLRPDVALHEN